MTSTIKIAKQHKRIARRFLNLVAIALLCQASGALARWVPRVKTDDRDPMIALPSNQGEQPPQEVQYVQYVQASNGHYAMAQSALAAAGEPRQEMVIEYQAQPQGHEMVAMPEAQSEAQQQYEMLQVQYQPQAQHRTNGEAAPDCNKRHELTALLDTHRQQEPAAPASEPSVSAEYAGQLVYVNQGGKNEPRNGTWSQASDLSATILTEVPVKDMPQEVLRKLRRDYGVKVVATRERPGANLVINCDEYSGQENSICSRHMASQEAVYQSQPMVENMPVEAGEAIMMDIPRQRVSSYRTSMEHVVQPAHESPSHMYAAEELTENRRQQTASEEHQVSPMSEPSQPSNQEDSEQQQPPAYEVGSGAPAAGSTEGDVMYEPESGNHEEANKESQAAPSSKHQASDESANEQSGHGQIESAAPETEGRHHQRTMAAPANPGKSQDSHELAAGFDEHHQNYARDHWQQDSSRSQEHPETVRRALGVTSEWSTTDEYKQAEPSEPASSGAHSEQTH